MTRTANLMARKGWSQNQMAAYLGLSQSQVSRLQYGVSDETGPVSKLLDLLEAEDGGSEQPSPDAPVASTGASS